MVVEQEHEDDQSNLETSFTSHEKKGLYNAACRIAFAVKKNP